MNKTVFIILLTLLFLTGCQSTLMEPASSQALTNAKSDKSQIVFIRSSFVGGAIQSSVFDVTSGTPEFIGIVSNNTKVSVDVEPGERMFMVVGESADFLAANVLADKTYYAVITPRMGFWKARFSLHPVRNDNASKFQYGSKEIQNIFSDTKLVTSGLKANNWFTKNLSSIKDKLAKYLPEWKSKDLDKRKAATIELADHLSVMGDVNNK